MVLPIQEFAGAGMTQQMLASGVTTQAVYNLAAQQNLQSQFQAQQMAAATMQVPVNLFLFSLYLDTLIL